jgi:hypothetical protein
MRKSGLNVSIDRATQDHWILGGAIEGVTFRMQQLVRVVTGPDAGSIGELISIYAIEPEPVYHLELLDGTDRTVRQSEIMPVRR